MSALGGSGLRHRLSFAAHAFPLRAWLTPLAVHCILLSMNHAHRFCTHALAQTCARAEPFSSGVALTLDGTLALSVRWPTGPERLELTEAAAWVPLGTKA